MSATPREGGPVVDPEDPTGPGAQLREARRRANLSLEEVAAQLRLDRRTLRALEENEFEHLPAPTFIRGYIRSYARLLGLPPGPILEAYDYQGFSPPAILADITQRPQARFSDFPVRLATYVVAAGLVAMVVMWWHSREPHPLSSLEADYVAGTSAGDGATPSVSTAGNAGLEPGVPEPPAPPAEALMAAEGSAVTPSTSDDVPDQAAASAGMAVEAPGRGPAAAPEPVSTDSASISLRYDSTTETPARPAGNNTVPVRDTVVAALEGPSAPSSSELEAAQEPASPRRLTIRFSEESWVEIFDADGIRHEYRLAEAGSSASVRGTPPFNVLLGYAPGATVTFDGENQDISRFIRGDTARFLIGPDGLAKARPPEPRTDSSDRSTDADPAPIRSSSELTSSPASVEGGTLGSN